MSRKGIASIIFICAIIVLGIVWYIIDRRDIAKYSALISPLHSISITDNMIQAAIQDSNFAVPSFGGTVFTAYQKLGETSNNNVVIEYLWLRAQEYYLKDGQVEKSIATSTPMALFFDSGRFTALNAPRDKNLYSQDVATILPDFIKTMPLFTDEQTKQEVDQTLQNSIIQQAEAHFNISVESSTTTATTTNF